MSRLIFALCRMRQRADVVTPLVGRTQDRREPRGQSGESCRERGARISVTGHVMRTAGHVEIGRVFEVHPVGGSIACLGSVMSLFSDTTGSRPQAHEARKPHEPSLIVDAGESGDIRAGHTHPRSGRLVPGCLEQRIQPHEASRSPVQLAHRLTQ